MKKIISLLLVLGLIFTQMSFTVMAEDEVQFQTILEEDYTKMAPTSTYKIPTDESGVPTSETPIQIGKTSMYINSTEAKSTVFGTQEVGSIVSGYLYLANGKSTSYNAYLNKECRFTWQPEGFDTIGNTYRITVDGRNQNSNSGYIMRFHTDSDSSNCYMLVVPACNRDRGFPGWQLYKRVEGVDTVVLSSQAITSQSTSGKGYLQKFTAEISVVDKKDITVHMVGKSNTGTAVNETFTYTDNEPFAHDFSDNYINMVPYGGIGTEIFSIKLGTVAKPTTKSYVVRDLDKFTVKTKYSFCDKGKTYVCGYKDGVLLDAVSRAYTKDNEEFVLNGDFDTVKVFM